jgi:hypothetical protein
MVEFRATTGGFDVLIDKKLFGHLKRGDGFFTSPTVVREFLVVSPEELNEIALKADEVKKCGDSIPICPVCNGTPNFPLTIYNPNEGMQPCQDHAHPFNIRHFGKL